MHTAAESGGSGGSALADRRAWARVAPVEWLALVGGLYLVGRYAWLMDDAFIYFRYVDNFLFLGRGMVWNAGEYVEGYSSAPWAGILILLRTTGLDFWVITWGLGLACYAGFWWLLVLLRLRIAPAGGPGVNVPLVYLTFLYGVLCYFTSGLETPLVQVSAVLYALLVLSPGSRALQVAVGATPLLRHELALPFLMMLAWTAYRKRRVPWPLIVSGAAFTGSWVLVRIVYYADLFPNTFYLKDEVELGQGLLYLKDTTGTYWFWGFLGLHLVLLAGLLARARKDPEERAALRVPERVMMLALALPIVLYVIKIGGDPRHYRYLAFPFVLAVCACSGLVERLLPARRGLATACAVAIGLVVAFRAVTFVPRQLDRHPLASGVRTRFVDKINDAAWHRELEELRQAPWSRGEGLVAREEYRAYLDEQPDGGHLRVSRHQRCVRMYRMFRVRFVHALGLTDPILARTRVPSNRPAHKQGLVKLSNDMRLLLEEYGGAPYPGLYREAVEEGRAPAWIADNLATIEVVERKMLNEHRLLENLGLALSFPDPIQLRDEDGD